MEGLNHIREAYEQVYKQLDERMDDDAKEMRRLAAQERRAGNSDRMDSKVASKYADSEAKSANKADKKSRGKHIHGMADSVELDGEVIESAVPGKPAEKVGALTNIDIPQKERDAARERTLAKAKAMREKKYKNEEFVAEEDPCWKGYTQVGMKKKGGREVPNCVPSKGVPKAKGYKKEELEIQERALDTAEKKEKERLVKGMKKSASDFKQRYGERAKSVMYATATKKAKEHMDTSKSDRRYAVEETDTEHRTRKPSQIAKREKLTRLLDQIRDKKSKTNN